MTKHISDWEAKFFGENGRQADVDESEQAVGYLYEMLDKVQFDLQDRMNAVMELSLRYRMVKEELEQIDGPIEIAHSRSLRGLSPVPRDIEPKFRIINPEDVQRLDPLDPAQLKNAHQEITAQLFGAPEAEFNDYSLNSMASFSPHSMGSGFSAETGIYREKYLRPLSGIDPPSQISKRQLSSSPEKNSGPVSASMDAMRETNLLKNRQFDMDQQRLEDEKLIWQEIYENVKMHHDITQETLDKISLDMGYAREEIKAIHVRRAEVKASISKWKRDFAIKNGRQASQADKLVNAPDLMTMMDQVEMLLKARLHVISNASVNLQETQLSMNEIKSHLSIAGQRAERGVSRENRKFDDKYTTTPLLPRNYASYQGGTTTPEQKLPSALKKSSGGSSAEREVSFLDNADGADPDNTTDVKILKTDQESFIALREVEQTTPYPLTPIMEESKKLSIMDSNQFIVLSESDESDREVRGGATLKPTLSATKPQAVGRRATAVEQKVLVQAPAKFARRGSNTVGPKKSTAKDDSDSEGKFASQKKTSPRKNNADNHDKTALKVPPYVPKLNIPIALATDPIKVSKGLEISDGESDTSVSKQASLNQLNASEPLSIDLLKQQKSVTKTAIKQWIVEFQIANNRAPTVEDKKNFALDLYTAYNASEKAYNDAKQRLHEMDQGISGTASLKVSSTSSKIDFDADLSSPVPSPRVDTVAKESRLPKEVSDKDDKAVEAPVVIIDELVKDCMVDKKRKASLLLIADLEKARSVAKKNIKLWVADFTKKNGREPNADEKKSDAKALYAAFTAIDNELELEKKNAAALLNYLQDHGKELRDIESALEVARENVAGVQSRITELEELKGSSKSDIENWNGITLT